MSRKISVIIPVYKVEKYLSRCVDSIINQSYSNLEIILVEDGSPDKSGEICDEYVKRDKRVKVIHQENKGLSGARNAGIDIATGDYIGFVDSDDYIDECMFEKLLQNAIEYQSEISICRLLRFTGETAKKDSNSNHKTHVFTSEEALKNLHGMDGQVYTVAWNKLYNKELFEGLRYPLRKINEDEFLTYKLIDRANRIVLTDEKLYYYFQNGDSITTNCKYLANQDIFMALEERKEYFNDKNQNMIPFIHKAYLDRIIGRYGMLETMKKADNLELKGMHKRYQAYYQNEGNTVKGIGYRVFYYQPKLYFVMLQIKKTFHR